MGKRQHYIPRMLLKGFASRSEPKEAKYWIWQIRVGQPPCEISTKHAAVKKNFYGDDNILEETLSEFESSSAEVIKQILSGEKPQSLSQELRMFVWTQALRTKSIHDSFLAAVRVVIDEYVAGAKKHDIVGKIGERLIADFDRMFATEIAKLSADEQIVLEEMAKVHEFRRLAIDAANQKMIKDNVQTVLVRLLTTIGDSGIIEENMKKSLRSSLNSMLSNNTPPKGFNPSHWFSYDFDDHSLVLGDICAFGIGLKGELGSIPRFGQDWSYVLLPISHSRLLVGSQTEERPTIDPERVNWASAALSLDTIYSSTNSSNVVALRDTIGSVEPLIDPQELSALVAKAWSPKFKEEGSKSELRT